MKSLHKVFEDLGQANVTEDQMQSLVAEVDLDMNSTIDLEEFLKVTTKLTLLLIPLLIPLWICNSSKTFPFY